MYSSSHYQSPPHIIDHAHLGVDKKQKHSYDYRYLTQLHSIKFMITYTDQYFLDGIIKQNLDSIKRSSHTQIKYNEHHNNIDPGLLQQKWVLDIKHSIEKSGEK